MDAPLTETWEELTGLAEDKKAWQLRVRTIKDTVNMAKIKKRGKDKGKKQKKTKKGRENKKERGSGGECESTTGLRQ